MEILHFFHLPLPCLGIVHRYCFAVVEFKEWVNCLFTNIGLKMSLMDGFHVPSISIMYCNCLLLFITISMYIVLIDLNS